VSHGAVWVLLCDLLEGSVCGNVCEGVEEGDAPVEVGLDAGRASDTEGDFAKLLRDAVIVGLLCGKGTERAAEDQRELAKMGHGRLRDCYSRVVTESGEVFRTDID
jgi:hypothetical protein